LAELDAEDVLLAMPLTMASAVRSEEIAAAHPLTTVSALADSDQLLDRWPTRLGLAIDLDVGMRRTGIDVADRESVTAIATEALERGITIFGLHAYDGHLAGLAREPRKERVDAILDEVAELVEHLHDRGIPVPRLVTSGTATFLAARDHHAIAETGVQHQVSPGTVVYCDARSIEELGSDLGYRPAVHVITRVVSAPRSSAITCDAGHKAVSADAGVPTCYVVDHPDLVPREPTEEHLQIEGDPNRLPAIGDLLELVPRHICPTVNLYDTAILIDFDETRRLVPVTARGRETNLF